MLHHHSSDIQLITMEYQVSSYKWLEEAKSYKKHVICHVRDVYEN